METVKASGYTLEKEGERFISVSSGTRKIKLGDIVISNGRFSAPNGTRGTVVEIHLPFAHGLSSDVIVVEWESKPSYLSFMKFKDFDLEAMANL